MREKNIKNKLESMFKLKVWAKFLTFKFSLWSEINNVINALDSNQTLQTLEITGNLMGDVGARLLAKALQINTRLRTINLDRNGISLQVTKLQL